MTHTAYDLGYPCGTVIRAGTPVEIVRRYSVTAPDGTEQRVAITTGDGRRWQCRESDLIEVSE